MGNNSHMIIKDDDFEALPAKKQRTIMYSTMNSIERRVCALEQKTWINKGKSFLGGIMGGAITMLGIKWGGL